MYDKVALLRGGYWAASKGGIYVQGCSLGIGWCIDHNDPDFVKSSPIAPEIVDVDLIFD